MWREQPGETALTVALNKTYLDNTLHFKHKIVRKKLLCASVVCLLIVFVNAVTPLDWH